MKKLLRAFRNRDWQLKRSIAKHQKKVGQDDYVPIEDMLVLPDNRETPLGRVLVAATDITGLDKDEEEM